MSQRTLSRAERGRSRLWAGFLVIFFSIVCFFDAAHAAGSAAAAVALLEKFRPGMTYEEAVELLAPAADTHTVGGDAKLVRRAWLHGEFGVEIYFVEDKAYRIDVISHFSTEKGALRAMDDILQLGRSRYGSVPQFDIARNEYFWTTGDYRLSFARMGARETRVSRMASR